jgi:hypothetical protein
MRHADVGLVDPSGTVTVIPGSISHGQGHETMYKILLSHRLGLDVGKADTAQPPAPTGLLAALLR